MICWKHLEVLEKMQQIVKLIEFLHFWKRKLKIIVESSSLTVRMQGMWPKKVIRKKSLLNVECLEVEIFWEGANRIWQMLDRIKNKMKWEIILGERKRKKKRSRNWSPFKKKKNNKKISEMNIRTTKNKLKMMISLLVMSLNYLNP